MFAIGNYSPVGAEATASPAMKKLAVSLPGAFGRVRPQLPSSLQPGGSATAKPTVPEKPPEPAVPVVPETPGSGFKLGMPVLAAAAVGAWFFLRRKKGGGVAVQNPFRTRRRRRRRRSRR